jgi:ABC-2 type transport system permease protein
MKLRHAHLWLVFFAIPLLPTVLGAANYLNNISMLKSEWYSLWTQHSLFYANFFYGPLIAIYCSYIWRVEHLNYNWNSLMTMPVAEGDIFLAKLLLALRCTVTLQLWVGVLFSISGKLVGLPGLPPAEILFWLLRGSLGGMVIAALQLLLSMMIRSFAVPIAIALLGSVAGFLLNNKGFGMIWPYSLMMMGMNANKDTNVLSSPAGFAAALSVFLVLFVSMGIWYLRHKDVHA